MSKKHFVALAREFRDLLENEESQEARAALKMAIMRVAAVCKESNCRFNKDRFYEACGIDG